MYHRSLSRYRKRSNLKSIPLKSRYSKFTSNHAWCWTISSASARISHRATNIRVHAWQGTIHVRRCSCKVLPNFVSSLKQKMNRTTYLKFYKNLSGEVVLFRTHKQTGRQKGHEANSRISHSQLTAGSTQKVKISLYRIGLEGCRGLILPEFLDNGNIKVARLSALAAFTPQGRSLILISVRGYVDPRAIMRPKG